MIQRIKKKLRFLSMRDKLQIYFTIPILAILFVIILSMSFVFQEMYERQLSYGISNAGKQANAFISTYLYQMNQLMMRIKEEKELISLLSEPDFGKKSNGGESYREFYRLNSIFQFISVTNSNYKIRMYLEDEIAYSNNRDYFFPLSGIKTREIYQRIMENTQGEAIYYSDAENRPNRKEVKLYLTCADTLEILRGDTMQVYIIEVQLEHKYLREVLENAQTIRGSISFLRQREGEILFATDESYSEEMKQLTAEDWGIVTLGGRRYYYKAEPLPFHQTDIVHLIPVKEWEAKLGYLLLWFFASAVIMSLLIIFITYLIASHYSKRISQLNRMMQEVVSGNIHMELPADIEETRDEVDGLYKSFDYMIRELRQLMKNQYKLGRSISMAEMRALQAQINPHFLYNTLDLINWSAMDYGADNIARIARDLGKFYRISLNHGSSVIRIADEIMHIESFVRIENVHYDNRIHMDIQIPEEIREYACLNIILQPFVENSIVHGIAAQTDMPRLEIEVGAREEGRDIYFLITDNGPGVELAEMERILQKNTLQNTKGFGIHNVDFRLKLLYGEDYGIRYLEHIGGTRVEIKIKALYRQELEELLL